MNTSLKKENKRDIKIVKMSLEKYLSEFGLEYDEGNLFDYPISELDYIMNDTEIEVLALIGNRLYELPYII